MECLLLGENEGGGVIHFDDMGGAVTTIFQVMTLEEWAAIMYRVMESTHDAALVFFVLLVLVGPLFAIQLFLVVIVNRIAQSRQESNSAPHRAPPEHFKHFADAAFQATVPAPESASPRPPPQELLNATDEAATEAKLHSEVPLTRIEGKPESEGKVACADAKPDSEVSLFSTASAGLGAGKGGSVSAEGLADAGTEEGSEIRRKGQGGLVPIKRSGWQQWQWRLRILAKSRTLTYAVMAVIVVNTVVMGMDYDCDLCEGGRFCRDFKSVIEVSNIGFTSIFIVEMLFKLLGLGVGGYFRSWLNCLDAVIVVVSVVEIPAVMSTYRCYQASQPTCQDYFRCEEGLGGMSVLRAFRLVRLVKMVKALPEVQKQVLVLMRIMASVASLIFLILLLLLVFLVLGMNTLGGRVQLTEWEDDALALGAYVFVSFPWDASGVARYGRITAANASDGMAAPWQVQLRFGREAQIRDPLRLDANGSVWAATAETASANVPEIVAVTPRLNFDDFPHALVSTFQVLTLSDWNESLYDAVGSLGPAVGFFYYTLILVGTWMLFNVFIAILIQEFAVQKRQELEEDLAKMQTEFVRRLGGLEAEDLKARLEQLFDSIDEDGSGEIDRFEFGHALHGLGIKLRARDVDDLVRQYDLDDSGSINFEEFIAMIQHLLAEAHTAVSSEARKVFDAKHALQEEHFLVIERRRSEAAERDGQRRSCFCCNLHLPRAHPVRRAAVALMDHPVFDRTILLCIFLSCVALAIDRPAIGEGSAERRAIDALHFALNAVFLAECAVKVVALSFREYIRGGWNQVDFALVVTSVVDEILSRSLDGDLDVTALRVLRIFRILRALRPLRIISRAHGLQVLVTTLLSSVRPVLHTSVLALLAFSVLGILGMQLLGGRLHRCSDHTAWEKAACVGEDRFGEPREWLNYEVNFDNFWQAMRSMFILATQDEWPQHMHAGIDATGKLTGPWQDHNLGLLVYYIGCVVLTAYLVVNIFVGVFVDCYRTAAAEMKKHNAKLRRAELPRIFPDPDAGARGVLFRVVTSKHFDVFIAVLITLNVVSMAFESWKPSEWQLQLDLLANFFFALFFGFECLIKLVALHPARYFSVPWNRFDYFIVMVSLGQIAADATRASVPLDPKLLRVLRVFRVLRVLRAFRLFRTVKGLQQVVSTLLHSLTGIAHLFSMLGLLFFVFGVLGVALFGALCTDGDQRGPGLEAVRCWFVADESLLPPVASFRHVGAALLTLSRVATADAWGRILTILQLAPGPRDVTSQAWRRFSALLGYDPAALAASDPRHFARTDVGAALRMAEAAIRGWNATAWGREEAPGWPMPEEAPEAEAWVRVGRLALPGCLTDTEVQHLEQRGLLACRAGGHAFSCPSTCGEPVPANLFFMLFVCISNFVLLQLVIAVLMDQLVQARDRQGPCLVPGCQRLTNAVLLRMHRRWRHKASKKMRARGASVAECAALQPAARITPKRAEQPGGDPAPNRERSGSLPPAERRRSA